ncbi:Terpenoid synthase [Mycena kentingensis (nom. inval.)]|nr:Terpenoid synthase [Mycena kentingensis (nom. inval.)]
MQPTTATARSPPSADSQVGAQPRPTDASVRTDDGGHPRTGERRVEEEVRVLDPGVTRRWGGGGKGPVGCGGCEQGAGGVGEGEERVETEVLPYVEDSSPTNYGVWEPAGIYERYNDSDQDEIYPLGGPSPPPLDPYEAARPRCFNCSETTHVLGTCPYLLDKTLVALSRQIFEFEKERAGENTAPRSLRELAERLERVEWTERFVPGRVSVALRAAVRWDQYAYEGGDVGEDDGNGYEWLANMGLWGYPKGWVSATDPRDRMRARILREREAAVDDDDEDRVMKIWGEDNETEEVPLSEPDAADETESSTLSDGDPQPAAAHSRRWAEYPRAYFAWECLTVYNGRLLAQRERDQRAPTPPPPQPESEPPPLPPPPSLPPPPLPPLWSVPVQARFLHPLPPRPSALAPPPPPLVDEEEEEMDVSD